RRCFSRVTHNRFIHIAGQHVVLSRQIAVHILQNDASLSAVNRVSWHPSVLKLAKNTRVIPERLSIKAATPHSCYSSMLTPAARPTRISSTPGWRHPPTSVVPPRWLSTIIRLRLSREPCDVCTECSERNLFAVVRDAEVSVTQQRRQIAKVSDDHR